MQFPSASSPFLSSVPSKTCVLFHYHEQSREEPFDNSKDCCIVVAYRKRNTTHQRQVEASFLTIMLQNTFQPDMLPSEVAFVEGHEIVRNKKNRKGATNEADEAYFEKMLKHELKGRKGGGRGDEEFDDEDDADLYRFEESSNIGSSVYEEKGLNDASSANISSGVESGIDSCGESSGTGTSVMGGAAGGLDRMLKGKDGMEFISDVRCCFLLGLLVAAFTLTIGVYSIATNDQWEDFYHEVGLQLFVYKNDMLQFAHEMYSYF